MSSLAAAPSADFTGSFRIIAEIAAATGTAPASFVPR